MCTLCSSHGYRANTVVVQIGADKNLCCTAGRLQETDTAQRQNSTNTSGYLQEKETPSTSAFVRQLGLPWRLSLQGEGGERTRPPSSLLSNCDPGAQGSQVEVLSAAQLGVVLLRITGVAVTVVTLSKGAVLVGAGVGVV